MTSVVGIRFAPLDVPVHRRRQTVGALFWLGLAPISLALFALTLYWTYTRPLAIAYMIWVLYWDQAPETGGRRSSLVRKWPVWRWMHDFFPAVLIKEADLDPERNYVFGYHPHGIISLGAWIHFATEASDFSKHFPGIHLRLMTLATNFYLPVFREMLLWLSIVSVSRQSCENILNKGSGHSVAIVVGGAQESLYARPGTLDLVLKKRLGFVKVAIRNGASLVPVLSIGENDVYDVIPTRRGTFAYNLQQLCKSTFGWTVPLFSGRGVFNYSIGVLPHRRRIATIVCAPVHPDEVLGHVLDVRSMSADEINEATRQVHEVYMQRLIDVWNKYKDEYAPDRVKEMEFVE